jgi:hypothetical protein
VLSSSPSLYHALQGRPCFFTIFASSDIKLHPTHVSRVDAILETHMGELLAPPASLERFNEIGPFVSQDIEVGILCFQRPAIAKYFPAGGCALYLCEVP